MAELGQQRNAPPQEIDGERIISYNVGERERPDGIKVRYKLRVVTGPRAKALDQAQAQVIREVLEWSRQHRQHRQRQER